MRQNFFGYTHIYTLNTFACGTEEWDMSAQMLRESFIYLWVDAETLSWC